MKPLHDPSPGNHAWIAYSPAFMVAVLRGSGFPLIAFLLLFLIVAYQLISGNLLNSKWGIWLTRKERPQMFWTIIALETAVVLVGLYIGGL
jgi:hypothetical protein